MILFDLDKYRKKEAAIKQKELEYMTNWHRVFLIWPTEVEGKLVWLQTVERKYTRYTYRYGNAQHRLLKEDG